MEVSSLRKLVVNEDGGRGAEEGLFIPQKGYSGLRARTSELPSGKSPLLSGQVSGQDVLAFALVPSCLSPAVFVCTCWPS